MKMDADENELLDSVELGEWEPAKGGKRKDLEAIRKRALAEDGTSGRWDQPF